MTWKLDSSKSKLGEAREMGGFKVTNPHFLKGSASLFLAEQAISFFLKLLAFFRGQSLAGATF